MLGGSGEKIMRCQTFARFHVIILINEYLLILGDIRIFKREENLVENLELLLTMTAY